MQKPPGGTHRTGGCRRSNRAHSGLRLDFSGKRGLLRGRIGGVAGYKKDGFGVMVSGVGCGDLRRGDRVAVGIFFNPGREKFQKSFWMKIYVTKKIL